MRNCVVILLLLALSFPNPLRLHVIANSNTEVDQQTKLAVRDAVLAEMQKLPPPENFNQARAQVLENGAAFAQAASSALNAANAGYDAKLFLGKFEFPTKYYEDTVYPAGYYDALRVVLGEGGGENWWCVMYPPLCVGQTAPKKVKFRSVILDTIRRIK